MACGLHAVSSNDGRRNKKETKNIRGGKEGANWTRQHMGFMLPCRHHPSSSPLPPFYTPSPISFGPPNLWSSCVVFARVTGDDVADGEVVRRWVGEHSGFLLVVE